MFEPEFAIRSRLIGSKHPCFVIAEAGVNHDGDPETALQLVDAAADAGADAVKFQTFKAGALVSPSAPKAEYQKRNTGNSESQYAMLKRLELSPEAHRRVIDRCHERGITFLSTPFDRDSAALLDELGVPAFKIGSGDITDLPLLEQVASFSRPIILSTGMSHLGEVESAVQVLERFQAPFALLHCVSNYPADPSDVNLRAMRTLATAFNVPVGYSDHTLGNAVTLAAVGMGACIIEKHFTLDRTRRGPDHAASLEPAEIAELVREIRVVEAAFGTGRKVPSRSELNTSQVARKSLVAQCDIPEGAVLTPDVIAIRRPGTGLPPAMRSLVVHRTARKAILAGEIIRLEDVA